MAQARAAALEAAGRSEEATTLLGGFTADQLAEAAGGVDEDDDIVVYDLDTDGDSAGDSDDQPLDDGAADGGTGGASMGQDGAPGPVDVARAATPREVVAPAGAADGEGEA